MSSNLGPGGRGCLGLSVVGCAFVLIFTLGLVLCKVEEFKFYAIALALTVVLAIVSFIGFRLCDREVKDMS